MMRNHYLHAGIRQEPTSRVLQYIYPNSASTMSWNLRFRLSGTPPKCGVNNVPRATPRKLRFPIWDVPLESGTYSYQGATSLDIWCTTAALDAWRRFSLPEKCSWYSNGNRLAPQYLGISTCAAQYFGTRRCSLRTHSTQNLQGRLWRPEGLKLHASLLLSPTGATVRDMGQEYLHRPYIWLPPSYRPSSCQGGGLQGLTRSTNVEIKTNQDGYIWTTVRINLL
jgi:hypothetical protein